MKAATSKELKDELKHLSSTELLAICARLIRFKKENKELLTYLLFKANNEAGYIEEIQDYLLESFTEIPPLSPYYKKKRIRKILKDIKKYIRYSQHKATEVELLLFFCEQLKQNKLLNSNAMKALYLRQITSVETKITKLHEDLQFDYSQWILKLK